MVVLLVFVVTMWAWHEYKRLQERRLLAEALREIDRLTTLNNSGRYGGNDELLSGRFGLTEVSKIFTAKYAPSLCACLVAQG